MRKALSTVKKENKKEKEQSLKESSRPIYEAMVSIPSRIYSCVGKALLVLFFSLLFSYILSVTLTHTFYMYMICLIIPFIIY